MLSDSAVYWLETYDLDGFRHDATKHIPLNFWRTLTDKVKLHNSTRGHPVYQIGETYGSPELIASYLSSGMLDAQFDFNIYDAALSSLVSDNVGFDYLAQRLQQSFENYGYNHLMGNMSGNQDKARFISLTSEDVRLDEDSKLAGWTRDIKLRTDEGFSKLAMMHAINMTIPGVPCIYYGDEIGMPGGNDPDNRKMMRFTDLSEEELQLKDQVRRLAQWRRSEMPLLYGNTRIHLATQDQLVFHRSYNDQTVLVLFNNDNASYTHRLPLSQGKIVGSFTGRSFEPTSGHYHITVPQYGFELIKLTSNEK